MITSAPYALRVLDTSTWRLFSPLTGASSPQTSSISSSAAHRPAAARGQRRQQGLRAIACHCLLSPAHLSQQAQRDAHLASLGTGTNAAEPVGAALPAAAWLAAAS